MVVCLSSVRMNMKADVLRSVGISSTPNVPGESMTVRQDPDSGEIIREWETIDEDFSDEDHETEYETFPCLARGIIEGGIRVAGTTERFSDTYDGVDYVRIWFPASVNLSNRDRITNIRSKFNVVHWKEEQRGDQRATVFSVNGVTPIFDYTGRHIENSALLERVGVQ